MTKDFELLKKPTDVIYNGICTSIESYRIYRPSWAYEGTDEEAEATLRDFYDSMGTHFYELNLAQMTPDMVDWEYDYVRIDTSDIPDYVRDLNEIVSLTDVDVPRDIYDLSRDELVSLRNQICIGSDYYSDFNNDQFVPRDEVMSESEDFLRHQIEEYGEVGCDEHLTAEEFADYFCGVA